ncbi:hypothetical protein ACQF36_30165 [Streptomyces sp. Marseille-Q5077]|uniref:hypothetical protein n=1 Tax=Streptomyces sp. Marseille-Q5077 TaxID=3418995 RepID=UPI003D066607
MLGSTDATAPSDDGVGVGGPEPVDVRELVGRAVGVGSEVADSGGAVGVGEVAGGGDGDGVGGVVRSVAGGGASGGAGAGGASELPEVSGRATRSAAAQVTAAPIDARTSRRRAARRRMDR